MQVMGVPTRDGRVWSALQNALRIGALGAAIAASAASGPGPDTVPDPDTCGAGQAGSIDTVEIGDADEASFIPLDDGDTADFALGSQGADMFPMRIRVGGADLPECLAQSTEVVYGGAVIASEGSPLFTYEDAAGTRATHTMYIIVSDILPAPGEPFEVRTTVGTITETRSLMRAQATSL